MSAKFGEYSQCLDLAKFIRLHDGDASVMIREGKGGNFWMMDVIFEVDVKSKPYLDSVKTFIESIGGHCALPYGRSF